MVANTASGNLKAVERKVVLHSGNAPQLFAAIRQRFVVRHTKWIMAKIPFFIFFAVLIKRKVYNPRKSKFVGIIFVLAQIGFVRFIPFHRFFIADVRKRDGRNFFMRPGAFDKVHHRAFQKFHNIVAFYKAHFQVNLGEFRLAVAPRVLIAKTARHLEITLQTGHH